jgi:hypothetical protein
MEIGVQLSFLVSSGLLSGVENNIGVVLVVIAGLYSSGALSLLLRQFRLQSAFLLWWLYRRRR